MKKKINYASLYTLRKDGRYQASYMDEFGRRKYVYDRDPENLWHKLNDPKEPNKIAFQSVSLAWENEHWQRISYKTAEAYTAPLRRLNGHFGEEPLENITPAEISAYLTALARQGYSKRSVQMHRDILNMVFNHAIVKGFVKVNPCAAVSMPRNLLTTKRSLPDDEAIMAVKNGAGAPFGLFALVCLYAGLRRGEALALQYSDIDRAKGVIHITKSVEFIGNSPNIKAPKTKAGFRDVILLDTLSKQIPDGTGYLFSQKEGGLLTKIQYRKRWNAYCKAIGHNITAHQLRHGFATILYEAGVPDKDAQELLGHSSISVTKDIYTHIRQVKREETAAKLNEYLKKI